MAGAAELEGLADELAAVEIGVRRIWEELCPYQYDPRPSGTAALIAVGEGGQSVRAVREELQHLSSQVRASRRDYEEAESLAAAGIRLPEDGWGFLPLLFVDLTQSNYLSRDAAEAWRLPGIASCCWAPLPRKRSRQWPWRPKWPRAGIFPPSGPLIRRLAEGSFPVAETPAGHRRRGTHARRRRWTPRPPASSPGSVSWMPTATEGSRSSRLRTAAAGRSLSSFRAPSPASRPGAATRWMRRGLQRRWGTARNSVNAAVLSALHQAGAVKGDQVVAVGYSQGGAHAMNLSSDKAFLAEFDLKYVLTAGSPVGGITPQPGITSLHLEHRQDWVPGSDGIPNPDTRDRVTVTSADRVVHSAG